MMNCVEITGPGLFPAKVAQYANILSWKKRVGELAGIQVILCVNL